MNGMLCNLVQQKNYLSQVFDQTDNNKVNKI